MQGDNWPTKSQQTRLAKFADQGGFPSSYEVSVVCRLKYSQNDIGDNSAVQVAKVAVELSLCSPGSRVIQV